MKEENKKIKVTIESNNPEEIKETVKPTIRKIDIKAFTDYPVNNKLTEKPDDRKILAKLIRQQLINGNEKKLKKNHTYEVDLGNGKKEQVKLTFDVKMLSKKDDKPCFFAVTVYGSNKEKLPQVILSIYGNSLKLLDQNNVTITPDLLGLNDSNAKKNEKVEENKKPLNIYRELFLRDEKKTEPTAPHEKHTVNYNGTTFEVNYGDYCLSPNANKNKNRIILHYPTCAEYPGIKIEINKDKNAIIKTTDNVTCYTPFLDKSDTEKEKKIIAPIIIKKTEERLKQDKKTIIKKGVYYPIKYENEGKETNYNVIFSCDIKTPKEFFNKTIYQTNSLENFSFYIGKNKIKNFTEEKREKLQEAEEKMIANLIKGTLTSGKTIEKNIPYPAPYKKTYYDVKFNCSIETAYNLLVTFKKPEDLKDLDLKSSHYVLSPYSYASKTEKTSKINKIYKKNKTSKNIHLHHHNHDKKALEEMTISCTPTELKKKLGIKNDVEEGDKKPFTVKMLTKLSKIITSENDPDLKAITTAIKTEKISNKKEIVCKTNFSEQSRNYFFYFNGDGIKELFIPSQQGSQEKKMPLEKIYTL